MENHGKSPLNQWAIHLLCRSIFQPPILLYQRVCAKKICLHDVVVTKWFHVFIQNAYKLKVTIVTLIPITHEPFNQNVKTHSTKSTLKPHNLTSLALRTFSSTSIRRTCWGLQRWTEINAAVAAVKICIYIYVFIQENAPVNDTVDGSEIRRSKVEVGSLSQYFQGFILPHGLLPSTVEHLPY